MSTTIVKITLFVALSAYILVNTVKSTPVRLRECELADLFFKNGFDQYQSRFSVCYAKSKHYVVRSITPYRFNDTSRAIFFFGMFPVTQPFCADGNQLELDSICGISCKHTNEYKLEDEVLCMKHIFEANLSEPVARYLKLEEDKLSDCMRTIFDNCPFSGPGGLAENGRPIFFG